MIDTIDVQTLKKEMNENNDLYLIDVREQKEWDESHIDGAKFLPLSNFSEEFKKIPEEYKKGKKVVLQCRSGKRSLQACHFLKEQGFENLYNLEGGILAWIDAGYSVL